MKDETRIWLSYADENLSVAGLAFVSLQRYSVRHRRLATARPNVINSRIFTLRRLG
jgi:hypothetical protein